LHAGADVKMYLLLAALVIGLGLAAYELIDATWATSAGVRAGEAKRQAVWERAKLAERVLEEKQSGAAAAGLEVDRAKERIVVRTITQYVDRVLERPVYRNVCLDDDGLRLARCAIRGEGADRCKPDERVPGPRGSAGRDGGGGAALDHVDGRALPGLSEEAAAPGGSREVAAAAAPGAP
jgi:hypothetical protein